MRLLIPLSTNNMIEKRKEKREKGQVACFTKKVINMDVLIISCFPFDFCFTTNLPPQVCLLKKHQPNWKMLLDDYRQHWVTWVYSSIPLTIIGFDNETNF
jgi:hypothetical protein